MFVCVCVCACVCVFVLTVGMTHKMVVDVQINGKKEKISLVSMYILASVL